MKNGYRIYALILAAGKGERAGFDVSGICRNHSSQEMS